MPFTEQGLPFAAGSHESYQAAERQLSSRAVKTRRYLRLLATAGPQTDHEARAYFGWPLSSINSIRNGAMTCGLVQKGSETAPSPYGGSACRKWELTDAGRAFVATL